MGESRAKTSITINRAPVLTLWAAVVAERLGYARDEALTLGRAVAGKNAQSKGRRLGIVKRVERTAEEQQERRAKIGGATLVELLGRGVMAKRTKDGLRAVDDKGVAEPASVERYLESKFGEALGDAHAAMSALAGAYPPRELESVAFGLYEQFRPAIPAGVRGWGAAGVLDLSLIKKMAKPFVWATTGAASEEFRAGSAPSRCHALPRRRSSGSRRRCRRHR
jgi:hypothetical protein